MQVAPVHRDAGAAGLDYASLQPLPKPRTFRLSSIPVGVPRDQLLVALEALSALSGIEDGTRPSSVKVLSLARKSRNWQVGTVSFVREPAPFTRCLPNDKIELPITIAGNEFDMTVDVNFYGMVLASAEVCIWSSNSFFPRHHFIATPAKKLWLSKFLALSPTTWYLSF